MDRQRERNIRWRERVIMFAFESGKEREREQYQFHLSRPGGEEGQFK